MLLPDRVTRRSTADDDDDDADAGASTDASLRPDVDTINAAPDTTRPTDTNDTNRLRFCRGLLPSAAATGRISLCCMVVLN